MPEIEQEERDDLDLEFDWDATDVPLKSRSQRQVAKEELGQERAALFSKGSSFKFTERREVVGIDNVLMEIDPVVHWLQNSSVYREHDARLEPGIIFEGEPGTGKTLVSRYIASASDALFINVREYPIPETLFGPTDISDLWARARSAYQDTNRPVVLFWDEFETTGAERASASATQAATTTQLLAELDGIHGKNEGVLLIGCTNYLYGVDVALRRAGRMGLHIEFTTPDREGKKILLDYYLGQYPCSDKIDVDMLSYFFDSGATAADIEEAAVEAWRLAVRTAIIDNNKPTLSQEHLIQVFLKRLVGPPTAFVNMAMEDRARIALHEVGHAVMALVYDIPLRLITVQPGKKSLGRCIVAEVREHIGTMDEWMSQMRVCIGSIVAEERGEVPPLVGSTGDVHTVNQIAVKLVDNLYAGPMTGLYKAQAVAGTRSSRSHAVTPNVSDDQIIRSDKDVNNLLNDVHEEARVVMEQIGKKALWEMANEVNERVTLTGQQFREVFEKIVERDPQEFKV